MSVREREREREKERERKNEPKASSIFLLSFPCCSFFFSFSLPSSAPVTTLLLCRYSEVVVLFTVPFQPISKKHLWKIWIERKKKKQFFVVPSLVFTPSLPLRPIIPHRRAAASGSSAPRGSSDLPYPQRRPWRPRSRRRARPPRLKRRKRREPRRAGAAR